MFCLTLALWQFFLTNRFYVDVRMFSNRSQMTSKYGTHKKVAQECVTDVFNVFCNLLVNSRRPTWNRLKVFDDDVSYAPVL